MQRCIYAIPNGSLFQNDVVMKIEKDVKETNISATDFRTKLQEMASGLKTEIANIYWIVTFQVLAWHLLRSYAFERTDIPFGENYFLKINYPFKDPPLPSDIKGELFSAVLGTHTSERALLNRLMIELHKLDSDVLVGHNVSGFDLDVLLHRAQACRVPSSMWSKIGRLKRSVMPKLTKGSTIFGSGASPGIMSCIAGRLLCDTYLCSRDLLKEVSYSLTQLAKTQLNKDRKEIAPHDVQLMFQSSESLMELIECSETDAWLSMELMFHLSVLPLTRQLTNISGNLWGKTLQGARAQRVEYLLLHAFRARKYIVPDKFSLHPKETKMTKRKVDHGAQDKDIDDLDVDNANFENDSPHIDHGKAKKGPAYAGGLVLEPKRGLYDKFVLLLDFNSLYPSIIREYNICFTTVERSLDGSVPHVPSSTKPGVLPELLKTLIDRRKTVKELLKKASGLKVQQLDIQQLDIQQQALKLTANSMYGCLGFSNSRFYAKPLAELITLQGREILQSTVDLVQKNKLNLEVIYGDTDSIMIYSGLDDVEEAKMIARKVIKEVNQKYKCLEIDLDGLYKRMLLLKKKKYAAVKLQFKDGTAYPVIERKGLDMVRRDWSLLSKELGDDCLDQNTI
ncbi:DNA-directed DNA polymerase [Actinidia rufa]|uniref:DNA polymerase n=1 Tax=Actinidia rufa TaxID=165716 RepID=A0A7J0EKP4_9ERIC|nr:DNA-directed DNA polymerase [Actinidia rufa]